VKPVSNAADFKIGCAPDRSVEARMGTQSYRADPGAYGSFAVITGGIAVLWLMAVKYADVPLLPVLVPAAGFGVVALWLSGFRLTIRGEHVSYQRLFRRPRRFSMEEVLTVEFAEPARPSQSPRTLCVRLISGEELRLDARIFPRAAMVTLLALGNRGKPQRSP
jgi:hypothetical protein